MMNHKYAAVFLTVFLFTAIFFACKDDAPTGPGPKPPGGPDPIEELIQKAGELPDPETHPEIQDTLNVVEKLIGNEIWSCSDIEINAAEAPERFPSFDPGAEVIWPGAALQGKSIQSPVPNRVVAKRSSGTVIINNITGTYVSSVDVGEVTHSNIINAANEIIRNQPQSFPANLHIGIEHVRSSEELALKLQANASFFSLFSANSRFEISKEEQVSSFLVTLNQSFYTLVFERPSNIRDFFHEDVTVDDLRPSVGENNPPVYISSVTYGRVFYLLIESLAKKDSMDFSLSASFIFGGGGLEYTHVSNLKGLSVQVFAMGGDQAEVFNTVLNGEKGLNGFLGKLRDGSVITTGKPLSYQIRSVRSDKVVKNGLATQYTVRECVPKAVPGISVTNRGSTFFRKAFRIDGFEYTIKENETICIPSMGSNPDTLWLRTHGRFGVPIWKSFEVNSHQGYEIRKWSVVEYPNNLVQVGAWRKCN